MWHLIELAVQEMDIIFRCCQGGVTPDFGGFGSTDFMADNYHAIAFNRPADSFCSLLAMPLMVCMTTPAASVQDGQSEELAAADQHVASLWAHGNLRFFE